MTRIPLAAKLAYTAWVAVWMPLYWRENGPSNFLWICDFANFALLWAIWRESALVASSQLAGILFIQCAWAIDFFGRLFAGTHPIGGTEYMFDAAEPLWLRALSLFHLWSVPLALWLVRRLGHDPRGWKLQTGFAALLFPAGVLLGTPEQNLNWMYAPFGVEQTLLPPLAFAAVALPIAAVLLFWSGDWCVRRWFLPRAARGGALAAAG
ncbi:MAG: hypothetical protein NDJ75_11070 [Thermoanaerobaculia bacterium]|nr:hypothetical protein [Thermoanaerobaculia bacterium]